jgi:hypothetical protein
MLDAGLWISSASHPSFKVSNLRSPCRTGHDPSLRVCIPHSSFVTRHSYFVTWPWESSSGWLRQAQPPGRLGSLRLDTGRWTLDAGR